MDFRVTARVFDEKSAEDTPVAISKEELRKLTLVNGWRAALHVLAEWAAIVAAVYFCEVHWSLPLYVATIVWIGSRQHALMILMHDGVHYRLFRHRRINELVSEVALGWPVLVSARAYRRNHVAHHRFLNTDKDPDWVRKRGDRSWVFPQEPIELIGMLVRELSGLGAVALLGVIRKVGSADKRVSTRFTIARYSFYMAVLVLALWTGRGKTMILYWFVPLFTWLVFIFRIRSIAEHSAIDGPSPGTHTRTTVPTLLERIFVAPKNVSYHWEHHQYPGIPFYKLPRLYALLYQKAEHEGHITRSYLGVLRECMSRSEGGFLHRKSCRRRISVAAWARNCLSGLRRTYALTRPGRKDGTSRRGVVEQAFLS
jgi:fatty acid desaturase